MFYHTAMAVTSILYGMWLPANNLSRDACTLGGIALLCYDITAVTWHSYSAAPRKLHARTGVSAPWQNAFTKNACTVRYSE